MLNTYSPNGAFLLMHKRSRIRKKHEAFTFKESYPKSMKGYRVYFFNVVNNISTFTVHPCHNDAFMCHNEYANTVRKRDIATFL